MDLFFFIYLVGVFIASFKKYLLRLFCPFLIGYLMLLLIHFSVLCVFWVLTVCKTNGRQISSRTLLAVSACLFPVLFKSPIVFDLAHFFKSCFCSLGCEGHKQIISVGIVSWSVSLMFYSGSFRSSRVILGLWSILVQREEQGWVSVIWVFLFPGTICWRGCSFCRVCFGTFCENQLTRVCRFTYRTLSCLIAYVSLFSTNTMLFRLLGSILCPEIKLGDASGFVLTAQKFFGCLGSFVLWNFRTFFFFFRSAKNIIDIFMGVILNP